MTTDDTRRPKQWATLEPVVQQWIERRYSDDAEGWKKYAEDCEYMRHHLQTTAKILAAHLAESEKKDNTANRAKIYAEVTNYVFSMEGMEKRLAAAELVTGREFSPESMQDTKENRETFLDAIKQRGIGYLLYYAKVTKKEQYTDEVNALAIFYDKLYNRIIDLQLTFYGIQLEEVGLKGNPNPGEYPLFLPLDYKDPAPLELAKAPEKIKILTDQITLIFFDGILSEKQRRPDCAPYFLELIEQTNKEDYDFLNGYYELGGAVFTAFDYAVLMAVCSFWLKEYPDPEEWENEKSLKKLRVTIRQIEQLITGCQPRTDKGKAGKHGTSGKAQKGMRAEIRASLEKMQNHICKRKDDPSFKKRFLNTNFLAGSYKVRGQVVSGGAEYLAAKAKYLMRAEALLEDNTRAVYLEMAGDKKGKSLPAAARQKRDAEIEAEARRRTEKQLKAEGVEDPEAHPYDCIVEVLGPPAPLLLSAKEKAPIIVPTPLKVLDIRRPDGRAIHTTKNDIATIFFLMVHAKRCFENPKHSGPSFDTVYRATYAEELEKEPEELQKKRAKGRRHDLYVRVNLILDYWKSIEYIGPSSNMTGPARSQKIYFDPNRGEEYTKSESEKRAARKRAKEEREREKRKSEQAKKENNGSAKK